MRIGQIRDGIAEDWDPGRLLRIERVDGQLLETDLRQQETWMPGEAWMPGIPLKSLEDPLKYRELVAQFRTQLLEITANKTGEQAGTEQPATRPESKSEGGDKPQTEAEGRSR
jgi:hypothetical protein